MSLISLMMPRAPPARQRSGDSPRCATAAAPIRSRRMSDPLRSLADAARAVTAAATDEDVLAIVAEAARDVIGARHGVARRGANGAPPGPRLVAPLIARDGSSLGLIELWDKRRRVHARRRGDRRSSSRRWRRTRSRRSSCSRASTPRASRPRRPAAGCCARSSARRRCSASARAIAGRLELQEIVQLATDAARELTPAQFGAFFYNVISDAGEAYMLYTLSGVERSAFERFPMPRNTDDLRADVQRRGDRPPRRRARRPALRPQRALPRHAGGPPAGPQLPRGAGRSPPTARSPAACSSATPSPACSPSEDERHGRGDRGAVGDRDRERAPLPGAHAHRPDAPARAAAAAPAARSTGSSSPPATAPRARATRSAATSTTSSSRATAAGRWSSATSAARARRPPR